jgi:hypothetical protein
VAWIVPMTESMATIILPARNSVQWHGHTQK